MFRLNSDHDLSELIRTMGGGSKSKLGLLVLLLLTAYGKEYTVANVQSKNNYTQGIAPPKTVPSLWEDIFLGFLEL